MLFKTAKTEDMDVTLDTKTSKTIWKSITKINECVLYKNIDGKYIKYIAKFNLATKHHPEAEAMYVCLNVSRFNEDGEIVVMVLSDTLFNLERTNCIDTDLNTECSLTKKELIKLHAQTFLIVSNQTD